MKQLIGQKNTGKSDLRRIDKGQYLKKDRSKKTERGCTQEKLFNIRTERNVTNLRDI